MNKNYTKNKVVILGGGTAGWLTALYLRKLYSFCDITVIEDPKRPPIIAGESGTITLVRFLAKLDIDNNDFIKKTNATPKLGGRFKNWNGVGTEFIHALQTDINPERFGFRTNTANLGSLILHLEKENTSDLYISTILANQIPLSKAFFSNSFIEENKVPMGSSCKEIVSPMWHFESRAAAAYFKDIALIRNIKLIEGEFKQAHQNENGDITSLILEGDRIVNGDWFFDCSGFSRLLLGKVLKESLIDYTNYFPARAVVAWWDSAVPNVTTNANAMEYGWSWNINLRHRSGNGYIYDPDHITLDRAVQEAEKFYGYKIDPIANFSFTPGIMKNAWKNNVIGIGLSSGFLEPLEANGVQVIIDSLHAVDDLWRPTILAEQKERQNAFNQRVFHNTNDIRDFLSLHYRGNRRDTDFWKSHAYDKFRISDSLNIKLLQWEEYYNGYRNAMVRCNGYSPTAWLMVIQALGLFSTDNLKSSRYQFLEDGKNTLNNSYKKHKEYVESFWTIDQWLKSSINN
jgi:tryptophan halogenase